MSLKNWYLFVSAPLLTSLYISLFCASLNPVFAQDSSANTITTLAGSGLRGFAGDGGLATNAQLHFPRSISIDRAGNVYIADTYNNRIRRVDARTGTITTAVGTGDAMSYGDGGPAIRAGLNHPGYILVDGDDNLLISDTRNHRIRKVDAKKNIITTIAGTGVQGVSPDGTLAIEARIDNPNKLFLDQAGNIFYTEVHKIRKIDAQTGALSTVAGTGKPGWSEDGGLATEAKIYIPEGISVDAQGNLFFTDNDRIRRVDAKTRIITTVAGSGKDGFDGDGKLATQASLYNPADIFIDASGSLFIADTRNHRIRKVDAKTGLITTVAGSGGGGYFGDGTSATKSQLNEPVAIAIDATGTLYIADFLNHRIRKVTHSAAPTPPTSGTYSPAPVPPNPIPNHPMEIGVIITVAGNGLKGYAGDSQSALRAELNGPKGIYVDIAGNAFIADTENHRVRQVHAATGVITTVAGAGRGGTFGDGGLAIRAHLNYPTDVFVDEFGHLYIRSLWDEHIRKVDGATGIISSVLIGDETLYHNPSRRNASWWSDFFVQTTGDILLADTRIHGLRSFGVRDGTMQTLVGTGEPGMTEDGSLASTAQFNNPTGVDVGPNGDLYIVDRGNQRIRKISASDQRVFTVAGTGKQGYNGDGQLAIAAQLNMPSDIAVDGEGNIFVADKDNYRIRRVDAQTGIITTVAGNGTAGGSGDGTPAHLAQINGIDKIFIDTEGNLHLVDNREQRVRKVIAVAIPTRPNGGRFSPVYATDDFQPPQLLSLSPAENTAIDAEQPRIVARFNEPIDRDQIQWKVSANGVEEMTWHLVSTAENGELVFTTDALIKPGTTYQIDLSHIVDSHGNLARNISWQFTSPMVISDESGIISTLAGGEARGYFGDGGSALKSLLNSPGDITGDAAGNLYITDAGNGRIRKVSINSGKISTVAGVGNGGLARDGGPANQTRLYAAGGISVDANGHLFIPDAYLHRIRRVDAQTGIVTTVAGNGQRGFAGDGGPAIDAVFNFPSDTFIDARGDLYIVDRNNQRIRRVDAQTGIVTTVAGNGQRGFAGDGGPAIQAALEIGISDIWVDTTGGLFIADTRNQRIRRVDAQTGTINTIAGVGEGFSFSGDGGPAREAMLYNPSGVAVDAAGNVFIADNDNQRIRRVDAQTSIITTVAGNGRRDFTGDGGLALFASFKFPSKIFIAATGDLLVSDRDNDRIRSISKAAMPTPFNTGGFSAVPPADSDPTISLVASSGTINLLDNGGRPTSVNFHTPNRIFVDKSGHLFLSDNNHRIHRIDAFTGDITTIAGTGEKGYSGDDILATKATLYWPEGIFVDASGDLYVADSGNHRVRRIDGDSGVITTVAGIGESGYSGDGHSALQAQLASPSGLFIDAGGNLFIADTFNACVRKVDAETKVITTVAGIGERGYSGDGGQATRAHLSYTSGIFIDENQYLYIADGGNHRIRKVDLQTGIITTSAGSGQYGYAGDNGRAIEAQFRGPTDLFIDSSGNAFVADSGNNRLRKIDSQDILSTIAGTGEEGHWGNGNAAQRAILNNPHSISIDSRGTLYFADRGNHNIRRVKNAATPTTLKVGSFSEPGINTSVKDGNSRLPETVHLEQNFPNPFNATTVLRFQLALQALTHIEIFNLQGQCIRILVSDTLSPGQHQARWDGLNQQGQQVASGIYLARLKTKNYSAIKKLLLIR